MAVSNRVKNGSSMVGGVDSSYGTNMLRDSISNPKIPSMSKNSKIIPVDVSYQGNTAALGVNGQNNPNFIELPSAKSKQKSPQIHTFGDQIDSQAMTYSANGIGGNNALPQNLLYKDNLVNLQNANNAVDNGGVTDEGVILGNPNVENATTNVNDDSSDNQTKPLFDRLVESAKKILNKDSADSTEDDTSEGGDVDTYEEFLNKQEGLYKQRYEDLLAQIEAERQRGVVDARSSYAQNLATYGANAEQLAAMGLSGSGYSDYLNQQAYATQRAETQGANAQAESNKMQAELSYAENMMNLEQSKMEYNEQKQNELNQYFTSLLDAANSGVYNSEQLATLGKQYGLDEAKISQLQAAAESYEQQKYADNYATILDQMLSELPYYNDDNKMLEFLEENKGYLGEQLYDFYKKQIDNIEVYSEQAQKEDETAKQEEQQKEEDKQIITGNGSIEYNGKYYRLDSQLDKGANQIVRNNDFKDKLKALGYSDPFDTNIPNGTTIKSKVDNKGSNDFNFWDDIGAFLVSPLGAGAWDSWANSNEITMTYYNGNWYLSSEV